MKPEAQRIAIAEACGWTTIGTTGNHGVPYGLHPIESKRSKHRLDDLPDYLNDLNAMHEVEKVLNNAQWQTYLNKLEDITGAQNTGTWWECIQCAVQSTAAQRSEAFLRTLNLWEE
jgi:hypothetical protein